MVALLGKLVWLATAILALYLAVPTFHHSALEFVMQAPPRLLSRIARTAGLQKAPLSAAVRPHFPFTSSHSPPSVTTLPQTTRLFSSSSDMASKLSFADAVHNRRTIYQLTKNSPISDERIEEIARKALEDVPSSFNSQSTRLVILLKEDHTKFWQIVQDILKAIVPEDQFEKTVQRLTGFSGGYGTILFYEDPEPIKKLQTNLPLYADKFPTWSEHTSAMHQYAIWTALEAEGLGANLQHYNPLPDQKVSEIWGVPQEWSLIAQLVFGGVADGAREGLAKKEQQPIEKKLFIHGK